MTHTHLFVQLLYTFEFYQRQKLDKFLYERWGLSHGNYLFLLAKLIKHEETWKYTNGSGWC